MSEKREMELKEPDIFHLLEKEDEQQIINEMTEAMDTSLVYEVETYDTNTKQKVKRKELSYAGVNYLCVLMTQNLKQGLKIVFQETKIMDVGGLQRWFATIVYKNEFTGLETIGKSEQTVMLKEKKKDREGKSIWNDELKSYEYVYRKYDDFGERKALSKAMRNAMKQQFPAKLILDMINVATKTGKVKTISNETKQAEATEYCGCSYDDMELTADEGGCRKCHKKVSITKCIDYKKRKQPAEAPAVP